MANWDAAWRFRLGRRLAVHAGDCTWAQSRGIPWEGDVCPGVTPRVQLQVEICGMFRETCGHGVAD